MPVRSAEPACGSRKHPVVVPRLFASCGAEDFVLLADFAAMKTAEALAPWKGGELALFPANAKGPGLTKVGKEVGRCPKFGADPGPAGHAFGQCVRTGHPLPFDLASDVAVLSHARISGANADLAAGQTIPDEAMSDPVCS